jgi:hypothetical protein
MEVKVNPVHMEHFRHDTVEIGSFCVTPHSTLSLFASPFYVRVSGGGGKICAPTVSCPPSALSPSNECYQFQVQMLDDKQCY